MCSRNFIKLTRGSPNKIPKTHFTTVEKTFVRYYKYIVTVQDIGSCVVNEIYEVGLKVFIVLRFTMKVLRQVKIVIKRQKKILKVFGRH